MFSLSLEEAFDGPNDPFCGHLWVGEPMDMVGFEAFLHLLIMWSFWSSYGIVTPLLFYYALGTHGYGLSHGYGYGLAHKSICIRGQSMVHGKSKGHIHDSAIKPIMGGDGTFVFLNGVKCNQIKRRDD